MPIDNILRPSVLDNGDSATSSTASNTNSFDFIQLKNIVSEIIRNENQQIIYQLTHPNSDNSLDNDQTIDNTDINLNEMDRIPDVVKSLREFSGNPAEYGSWKKSVDRILKIYENLKGKPKYYGILSVIRNKITGSADTALESYNTPLNWDKISKCLALHYADKRDLGTLEYQMTTLIQKNNSIPEFYKEVYYHLSLILNKLSSVEMGQESLNVMTQAYRDKALDTFIRGLKGDLPRLLSMREPIDLPEALHLCLKLENVHYRVQHSHGNIRSSNIPLPSLHTPWRPHTQNRSTHPPPRTNFYPQLLHNPQAPPRFNRPQFSNQHSNQFSNQHSNQFSNQHSNQFSNPPRLRSQYNDNNFSNSLPKPEPMEVDHSIRSRQANYQNRPKPNHPVKRPLSTQVHPPTRHQRVYNIEQSHDEHLTTDQYQEQSDNYNENCDQYFSEYSEPQLEQLDDINFLD